MRGKHILLAKDNDLNAEIAVTVLEETGFVVERVEDGIQCVNKVEQMSSGMYDLILMDIQMPNMDGYQAARCIRHLNDKKKAQIPIIAMTANAFAEDRKRAFGAGMNEHIAKPIDIEKLEAAILSVLNERQLQLCSFGRNKNIEKISIKDVYEAETKIKHTGGDQLGKGNHKLEKNEKFTNHS